MKRKSRADNTSKAPAGSRKARGPAPSEDMPASPKRRPSKVSKGKPKKLPGIPKLTEGTLSAPGSAKPKRARSSKIVVKAVKPKAKAAEIPDKKPDKPVAKKRAAAKKKIPAPEKEVVSTAAEPKPQTPPVPVAASPSTPVAPVTPQALPAGPSLSTAASLPKTSVPPALVPEETKKRKTPDFFVPPILLEGDGPSATMPVLSTVPRRERPLPKPEAIPLENGTLPEAYGTGVLMLRARDPHWLYAYWDLSRENQREYNALSADGRLALRVYRDAIRGNPLEELKVHPESQHWFVHVPYAGAKYITELGYYRRDHAWISITQSTEAETPGEGVSQDRTVEMRSVLVTDSATASAARQGVSRSSAVPKRLPEEPVRTDVSDTNAAEPVAAKLPLPQELPLPGQAPLVPSSGGVEPSQGPVRVILRSQNDASPTTTAPGPAMAANQVIEILVDAGPAAKAAASVSAAPRQWPATAVPQAASAPAAPVPQVSVPTGRNDVPVKQVPSNLPPKKSKPIPIARAPLTPEQEQVLFELIYGLAATTPEPVGASAEMALKPERQVRRAITSPAPVSPGAPAEAGAQVPVSSPGRPEEQMGLGPGQPGFWFQVNAELVIYGATEPTAAVTISGRRITLRPDGTFSYRFALPDGAYGLDISATSVHHDSRQALLRFSRESRYEGQVGEHRQDPGLKEPSAENLA